MEHKGKSPAFLSLLPFALGLLCFAWIAVDRLHNNFTLTSAAGFLVAMFAGVFFYWLFIASAAVIISRSVSYDSVEKCRPLKVFSVVTGAFAGAGVFFLILSLLGL